jgi:carboxyl-terminal processing protease
MARRLRWGLWVGAVLLCAAPASAQDVGKVRRYLQQVRKHLTESYLEHERVDAAALDAAAVEGARRALKSPARFPALEAEGRQALLRRCDEAGPGVDRLLEAVDAARRELDVELDLYRLADAAAAAMIERAGDEYGRVLSMPDLEDLRRMLGGEGSSEQLGVAVRPDEQGRARVFFVYFGRAADRAGLRPGDVILSADGRPAAGLESEEFEALVSLKDRDAVRLSVLRPGMGEPLEFTATKPPKLPPVVLWSTIGGRIGYLRLTMFTGGAPRAVRRALAELRRRGVRGLILDLRNNPGGDLRAANLVADEFVEQGRTINTIEWSYRPLGGLQIPGLTPPDKFVTRRKGDGEEIPMVVLVNRCSASASELVAGALKDLGRATLVGEPTFGKGVGQGVIPLAGLLSLDRETRFLLLTILRYRLPGGGTVGPEGVAPHAAAPDRRFDETELRALLRFRADPAVGRIADALLNEDPARAEALAEFDDFDAGRYPNLGERVDRAGASIDLVRSEVRRALRDRIERRRGEPWPYDLGEDEPLQRAVLLLAGDDAAEKIDAAELRKIVEALASDAMRGREAGTEECRKAAEMVAARFKELGLVPAGEDGYFQRVGPKMVNVHAVLEGSDAALAGECVVVGAHHDGQGVLRDGRVRNSADDNASGVAMMLEIAEAFTATEPRPKRSVLFQSYDGEEKGFMGSLQFTRSELFARRKVVAMICFDLVGGRFTTWETNRIYALGAESSPQLARILKEQVEREKTVEVVRAGIHLLDMLGPQIAGSRSDYCAFRAKQVPYIFFSTGTPWYYHTPEDDPERLDYPKMQSSGRFVYRTVRALADSAERYEFVLGPVAAPSDAGLMAEALGKFLEHRKAYRLTDKEAAAVAKTRDQMAALAAKAELTDKDRGAIQRAMVVIFLYASRRPDPE